MVHGNPRVRRSSARGWAAALVSTLAAVAALGTARTARAEEWPVVPVQHFARTFEVRGTEAARVLKFRLDEAQRFVRECRSDLYDLEMSYFRADIDFFKQAVGVQLVYYSTEGADALRQNIAEYTRALEFLRTTRDQRFRDCVRPPSATPPAPEPPRPQVPLSLEERYLSQYNLYANLNSGVQFDQFKETTLGTIFVPGADRPFLFSRGAATGFSIDAGIGVERTFLGLDVLNILPTPPVRSGFTFRFTNSSATASASTAPGETAVFTLLEPVNGVPVIGIGRADATVRSSLQSLNFQYTETWRLDEQWGFNVGLRYQRIETEHVGKITSPLLPDFLAKQTLRTNDNYVGPLFGLQYTAALPITVPGTNVPIVFEGTTWLSPTLRISDGSARQSVRIPGAAPPFNDLSVSTDDSRVGFALLGGAEAAIAARITPNFTVRLAGGVRFNTAQSHYVAPISPGQPARFTTDFQAPRQFRLGATFRF